MINVTKETFDEFMIECGKAPLLTLEQIKSYIEQAQQGNTDAMQAICNATMRFVVSFANTHKGSLDIISAIHIAEPGLIYAVQTYDTASDIKFVAYAAECMKERFKNNLSSQKIVTERSTIETESRLYEDGDSTSIQSLKKMSDEEVREKLDCLTNREREVMQMLIGYGCACMTVDEVADHFELLPSRIRQIRDKALKKINSPKK